MTNNWLHKSTRLHFQVHSWPQFAIYRFWQKFTVQKKEKRKPSVVFCKICELGVSIIQDGQWQKNIATFWAGLQSLLSPKVTEIIVHSIIPVYWANFGILLQKLFWPTLTKKCSSDWEKLLKFEAVAENLQKFWDH